jgi:hypothetical protein
VPDAGDDIGMVLFYLHSPTAPISELAPGKLDCDIGLAQTKPCGNALEDDAQPFAV